MIKHIKSKIVSLLTIGFAAIFSLVSVSGCALIKDGEEISWSKVDTVASVIKLAARTSTYAVCVKNKDLQPVFKAIGEGLIVISGQASGEQLTPDQIKAYIDSVLAGGKWGTLSTQINDILQTMINAYTSFYETNKDKFKDEVNVMSEIVKAMGEGFVEGSNIDAVQVKKVGDDGKPTTAETERDKALSLLNQLNFDVSK